MEAFKPKPQTKNALRRAGTFLIERARGGAYAELADRYAPQIADAALQDTIAFEPVGATIIEFPHGLRLKTPPEHGWELPPAA